MLKFSVGTLVTLVAMQFAQAQVTVDISKITCEQFNVLAKANSVALWLGGYYHGQKRDPVIEVNTFEENVSKLRAACMRPDNFTRPVMQLIESQTK